MRIYENTIAKLRKEFDDHRDHILALLGTLQKEETVRINPDCTACVRGLTQYEECMEATYADLETLCRHLDTFASMVAIREEGRKGGEEKSA